MSLWLRGLCRKIGNKMREFYNELHRNKGEGVLEGGIE